MHPPSGSTGGGALEGSGSAGPGGDAGPSSWKACVYYARGFCKHGASCRFSHDHPHPHPHPHHPGQGAARGSLSPASSGEAGEAGDTLPAAGGARGLPWGDGAWLGVVAGELQELLLAHGAPVSLASLPHLYSDKFGKALEAEGPPREGHHGAGPSAAASPSRGSPAAVLRLILRLKGALTVFERPDGQKAVALKRGSPPKGGEGEAGGGGVEPGLVDSPSSRQIYLTFPAESSFSEADVALHFGLFGTVHDVRIPHQQKRMFGFVTFAGPEPVRAILKHGNPHFICGSRVLVKPYRERAKPADRYKHTEGGKGAEPFKHVRVALRNLMEDLGPALDACLVGWAAGPLDSKIPPRHQNSRLEGKAGLATGPRAGAPQAWGPPPVRSGPRGGRGGDAGAESSEALHLPRLGAPGAGHGAPAHRTQGTPDPAQAAPGLHLAIAPSFASSAPTHLPPATPCPERWAESQALDSSPWPRARLFQDSDSTQGACGAPHQDILTTGSSGENVEDDSSIDLDSLLPESPFSSPKGRKAAGDEASPFAAAGPGESVLRSCAGEWQPSSLPAAPVTPAAPAPLYWGYGEPAAYLPVSGGHWAGEAWPGKEAGQGHGAYAMMAQGPGLQELTHGMAYLAVGPGPPHTGTLEASPVDASSMAKRTTLLCSTCRAQPVVIPNSQCTYCLQRACHNYAHEAHLYQEVTPSWHVPVNSYVRASHNSSC